MLYKNPDFGHPLDFIGPSIAIYLILSSHHSIENNHPLFLLSGSRNELHLYNVVQKLDLEDPP